jgi:ubiquinone/menaquinone biosynthesis C-methylase UbiE
MRYNTFDDTAGDYDLLVTPCRVHQVKALIHELCLHGVEKALEVGCGSGLLTMEMLRALPHGHLTAIDLSPNMLSINRAKTSAAGYTNVLYRNGNAEQLDFPDDTFDVIVSSNVLPWVEDQNRFVREIKRVLKPQGKFGLIALAPEVYREFFDALDNVRAVYPCWFNGSSIYDDIGVRLEPITAHCERLRQLGFAVGRSFTFATVEPILAHDYIRRFNAVTGETQLSSVPSDKRDLIRAAVEAELERRNGNLTVTEAINLVVAQRLQ